MNRPPSRPTTPAPRRARRGRSGAAVLLVAALGVSRVACVTTNAPRARLTETQRRETRAFPFADYDALLRRYVDDQGRVDYRALRAERAPLDRFLAFVAEAGPSRRPELFPTRQARLAFYIAAYNATVWRNVIDRGPIQNIETVRIPFFYSSAFVIDGRSTNLLDLETTIRRTFDDPRVHAALNCASASCPRLPAEAFTPERLDAQLDREMREFVGEERNVRVIPGERKVVLSKIFEWYESDFVQAERARGVPSPSVVTYINRYRAPDAQIPADFAVDHVEYDWTINAQHAPGQTPSS